MPVVIIKIIIQTFVSRDKVITSEAVEVVVGELTQTVSYNTVCTF